MAKGVKVNICLAPLLGGQSVAIYVVKLNVTVAGVDIVELPSEEQYEIGQVIAIKTNQPTTYNSDDGRSLTVRPGIQLGGRVVDIR
jgi:hypothetical protein